MDFTIYCTVFCVILVFLCVILFIFYSKIKQELHTWQVQSQKESKTLRHVRMENDELIQAVENHHLEQNSQAEFYALAGHQMQSCVNTILGMTQIAKKNETNPGRLMECHHRIESSASYLASLLENVSAYSEVITDTIPASQSFDLKECITTCYDAAVALGEEQAVSVILDGFTDFAPPRVLGVPSYLERIFTVLFHNAIQYNKAHGTVVFKAELLSTSDDSILCQFCIRDTGIGMQPEFLKHIFEPFTQANAKLFESWQSTGLSLAIVKEMIEKMEGEITVTSEANVGSEFIVLLPLPIDKRYVPENVSKDFSSIRVLLADGNPLSRELIGYHLREAGISTDIAEDGRIAVNKVERSKEGYYDFVLMDAEMPIMDGVEAVKCIRGLSHPDAKKIPILGMSTHTLPNDTAALLEAGMNQILHKPLDMKKVLEILKGEAKELTE